MRYAVPNEKPRKGRPRQIGSLIPEAARALGFEAELVLAQQAALLTSVLNEIAPIWRKGAGWSEASAGA